MNIFKYILLLALERKREKGARRAKRETKTKKKWDKGKMIHEIFYFTMFSAPRGAPGNFRQTGYRAHRHPYSLLNSEKF